MRLERVDDDAFLDLWSLDELPACEAGIKLLKVVFDGEEQPVFWNTLRLYAGGVSHTAELRNPPAWDLVRNTVLGSAFRNNPKCLQDFGEAFFENTPAF
jgi:hypothetical protein